MRLHGFASIPCGLDGPDAWAIAEAWNARWDATRRGEAPSPAKVSAENLSPDELEALTIYQPRSLGRAFQDFRATESGGARHLARARIGSGAGSASSLCSVTAIRAR